ncbi:DUF2066 domain-containing protein [Mesorhizobium sp. BAC0120]|uniref:DUF2066 domain-containing protein n=1 Tax=Mesorhizobium sp. BAC0120 TaxID=3090670 RepID=UPI00298D0F1C|nr:DUF2066 domain-containing protein [Mesorhizobium sp. BAC0120]MDW6021485.1 DUF2066 domain-containing protein [Mesorhizobium sp. BAC0120]
MRWVLGGLLCAFAALSPAAASDADTLYRAVAIVTGTGEENRQIGFRLCMEDVIVRVSGDYRLITSGKAAGAVNEAAGFVDKFKYRDRLEGIPVHDEQGTHDRPHDLTVDFNRAKLDAALAEMGSRPWLDPRPRLTVILGVKNATSDFVLTAEGEQGFYMRDSFAAASDKIAIPIALPSRALVDRAGLTTSRLSEPDPAALDEIARAAGGDKALAGTLIWSDEALGWTAEWRLDFQGKPYRWRIAGVSFDDAFRNALRGAAQVFSGNGEPQS